MMAGSAMRSSPGEQRQRRTTEATIAITMPSPRSLSPMGSGAWRLPRLADEPSERSFGIGRQPRAFHRPRLAQREVRPCVQRPRTPTQHAAMAAEPSAKRAKGASIEERLEWWHERLSDSGHIQLPFDYPKDENKTVREGSRAGKWFSHGPMQPPRQANHGH